MQAVPQAGSLSRPVRILPATSTRPNFKKNKSKHSLVKVIPRSARLQLGEQKVECGKNRNKN